MGLTLAVLLLPSVGPTGSSVLLARGAWAANRSATPIGPARTASAAVTVTAVAGGLYHGLALTSTGAVLASGWNIAGQLGNGSTNDSDVPVSMNLPNGTKVIGIAAGFAHSLAVTSTGAIFSCGKNRDGELGNGELGDSTDRDVPVRVSLPAGTKATAVAAGAGQSLALTSTGAVLAWGLDNHGQLGNGGSGASAAPATVRLPPGTRATAIAAGALHSLALTSAGAVYAWGYNADGELGNGSRTESAVPVAVKLPVGTKVTAIAAGAYDSLALTSTGAVYAWGYNRQGELGDGRTASSDVPVKVKLPAGTKVTAIASGGPLSGVGIDIAGPGHSLALTSSGTVLAWGHDKEGELGDGGSTNRAMPVKVKLPAGTRVTAIAAGALHSVAVTSTGAVLAWGRNNFGQFGNGSYQGSGVPVAVTLPGLAAERTATLRPALVATGKSITARSTTVAGYEFANYIAVPGAVSAIATVPRLNCTGTPSAGSAMYVGVGIQSVNSYARLYLACTRQGVAGYYPALTVDGSTMSMASDVAQPGDKIEFAVSQSDARVTDSVIDMTHAFIATSSGGGGGTGEGLTAGVYPVVSGATMSALPNFGTIAFTAALINAYPFGSATPDLHADDLYASSTGPLDIKTTYSSTNKENFRTVFKHS